MKLGVMANCFLQDPWEVAVKKAKGYGPKAIEPAAGGYLGNKHCKPDKWQWEKRIIQFWREMGKHLSDSGIVFAFEMHPGDAVYNKETLLMLRNEIGDVISCNFDPSHIWWQGIDPLLAIKKLQKAIVHVHAKDIAIDEDLIKWRGNIDWKPQEDTMNRVWTFRTIDYGHDKLWWKKFVSTLILIGYDGVLSIEYEDSLMSADEGLRKAVAVMDDTLIHEKAGETYWTKEI